MTAHPMPKFFTFGEQPETAELDLSKAKRITLKPDGSLMSSYIDVLTGELCFKTKRKLKQASFDNIINEVMTPELHAEMLELTISGYTIDCELTSPQNRVILNYDKASLTVLKVRSRLTGEFVDIYSDTFKSSYPEMAKRIVEELDKNLFLDLDKKNRFLDLKGIEGGVVEMPDGTLAKVKTKYYLTQNRFANLQAENKRKQFLLEACMEETFDELRTLFHYRKRSENYNLDGILNMMDSVEQQVNDLYNPMHKKIMTFFEENKELSIPDYSAKAKEDGMVEFMSVLVPMRKGVNVNLKNFFLKKYSAQIKLP